MTASSSEPLGDSSAAGQRCPDRARTAPPQSPQLPTSTGMRQMIVIGVRRPTLPGSACAHRGSGAAGWLGCAPDLAGPGRSFGLRPYLRQVSDDRRNVAAHPAQVRQSLVTRGPYRRTGNWVNQTRPAAGSAAGAAGDALPRRPATRSAVAQPAGVHSTTSPPPVCGPGQQLRCSACPTAVIVPLPVQLPRHGQPGVRLGKLQLSAP
jgi:hypothetical protein